MIRICRSCVNVTMRKAAVAEKLVSLGAVKCAMLGIIGMIGLLISAVGPFKVPFAETLAKTYYRQAIVGLVVMVALVGGLDHRGGQAVRSQPVQGSAGGLGARAHAARPRARRRAERQLLPQARRWKAARPRSASAAARASSRRIDKARVTIAWLPLLRGRVHIDSAEIEGLRAQLVRLKDGSTNVDDLAHDVAAIESTQRRSRQPAARALRRCSGTTRSSGSAAR